MKNVAGVYSVLAGWATSHGFLCLRRQFALPLRYEKGHLETVSFIADESCIALFSIIFVLVYVDKVMVIMFR